MTRYSLNFYTAFWAILFVLCSIVFSVVATEIFFKPYLDQSSLKDLKHSSFVIEGLIKKKKESLAEVQAIQIDSGVIQKKFSQKRQSDIFAILKTWEETYGLSRSEFYSASGELLGSGEKTLGLFQRLGEEDINELNSGGFKLELYFLDKRILFESTRAIKNTLDELLGYLVLRDEISYSDLEKQFKDQSLIVVSPEKRLVFVSKNLGTSRSEIRSILSSLSKRFSIVLKERKYDFLRIKDKKDIGIYVGQQSLSRSVSNGVYQSFLIAFGLFFLFLGILFHFSFSRQVFSPLKQMTDFLENESQEFEVKTSISEIDLISKEFARFAVKLETKVETSKEGRKRDMSRLVASVAHELNNSLSYLGGNLDYINMELSSAEQLDHDLKESIEGARDGFKRIKKIVSDLKVFSDVGNVEEDWFNFEDLKKVILGQYSDIQIEEPEGSVWIKSDIQRIEQILVNLIKNGTQAASGSAVVKLWVEASQQELNIFVSDESGGIPAHLQEDIFEPFFTTKKNQGGAGLGLSLSKNIAQSLQGDLSLISSDPKGSLFCLTLSQFRIESKSDKY